MVKKAKTTRRSEPSSLGVKFVASVGPNNWSEASAVTVADRITLLEDSYEPYAVDQGGRHWYKKRRGGA